MKFQNIYNNFSTIYYTIREGKDLIVKKDESFFPYFYEPNDRGEYLTYDGIKVSKVSVKAPHEIKNVRTTRSYEADVIYTKRYLIDKVGQFDRALTKFMIYDIEVKAEKEFPDPKQAKVPVTFITCWNNYDREYVTFDYRKFPSEYDMLMAFSKYVHDSKLDMMLAWNHNDFDYPYLYHRLPDFPKLISPIGMETFGGDKEPYPALVAILDLMALDHKFTGGKRPSYALDSVAQEEFEDEETWGEHEFGVNDDDDLAKNINDVKRTVRLVEKNRYIELFDAIRIFSRCLWEDLPSEKKGHEWQSNNSKPWDMIFLRLAKENGIILPSKPKYNDGELDKFETDVRYKRDGAYRETFKKGIFINEKA